MTPPPLAPRNHQQCYFNFKKYQPAHQRSRNSDHVLSEERLQPQRLSSCRCCCGGGGLRRRRRRPSSECTAAFPWLPGLLWLRERDRDDGQGAEGKRTWCSVCPHRPTGALILVLATTGIPQQTARHALRAWIRKLLVGVGNAMGGPPIRGPAPNFLIRPI